MTGPFVKLYGSILDSSVWSETTSTRIVWITLLAMADGDGQVFASVGGLARRAQVTRQEVEAALAVLLSPDPDDRSGVDEGRRLRPISKGWQIVNHRAYRDLRTPSQVQTAERVRRHRERRNGNGSNVTNVTGNDVTTEAEAEAKADREKGSDSASQSSAASHRGTAKGRKPKPAKKVDPPDPRVTELRDFYVEEFQRTKAAEPLLGKQWPRAMKGLKELLEATTDLELAKSVIRRALSDPWSRDKRCLPWEIATDASKFVGTPAPARNGNGPRQPNTGVVQAEDYMPQ